MLFTSTKNIKELGRDFKIELNEKTKQKNEILNPVSEVPGKLKVLKLDIEKLS